MALQAGVGFSKQQDAYQAGYEACKKAVEQCGEQPNLTIVFASVSFDQNKVIQGIREASNNAPLVGCSDAGEITNEGPSKDGVAVMAIASDKINFSTGLGRN